MKYFTFKLWKQINDMNLIIRENANKEWVENIEKYSNKYKKVKLLLPSEFIEVYENEFGFHDWEIEKIQILPDINSTIQMILQNNGKMATIYYKNVKSFKIDIVPHIEKEKWGYDEFSLINDDFVKHEILFLSGSIVSFIFKEINVICI
ncbi:MAG: hypothetical protein ACYCYI_02785 [Saccharofermentanales bacterium]